MNIDFLEKYVTNKNWETKNLREVKKELLVRTQEKQKSFAPLDRKTYSNNPIQLIDFFCGGGHVSRVCGFK